LKPIEDGPDSAAGCAPHPFIPFGGRLPPEEGETSGTRKTDSAIGRFKLFPVPLDAGKQFFSNPDILHQGLDFLYIKIPSLARHGLVPEPAAGRETGNAAVRLPRKGNPRSAWPGRCFRNLKISGRSFPGSTGTVPPPEGRGLVFVAVSRASPHPFEKRIPAGRFNGGSAGR